MYNNIFKCVALCLALIGGIASGMGCAAFQTTVALFGVLDLAAVIFITWFEPNVKDCRLGMVTIETILWFVGFFAIIII